MRTSAVRVACRSVAPGDGVLLRRLFVESRPDLALLPAAHRESVIDMQLRAQDRQFRTSHPNARHEILVADGIDVGRIITDRGTAAIRLVDLVVRERYRGRGIATEALCQLLAEAAGASLPVSLSVWSTNMVARKMYEGLGFVLSQNGAGHLEMNCAPGAGKDCS